MGAPEPNECAVDMHEAVRAPTPAPQVSERVCIVTLLITAVLVAVAVCALGWFTNLRLVAHATIISAGIFLGFPFAIILFGLALAVAAVGLSAAAALLGGGGLGSGGEEVIARPFLKIGSRLMGPYYRMLARIRHPMIWGFVFGVLSGGVALACLLWFIIIPGETETVQTLADVREKVAEVYKQTGRFPQPDANGHLPYAQLSGTSTGVVLDGFGRPLEYRITGMKMLAKVHLRSLGYDGLKGRDDLCISQETNLRKWIDAVKWERDASGRHRFSIKIAFSSIRDMRCPD